MTEIVTIIGTGTKVLSGIGVSTIIGNACKAFVPVEQTIVKRVCCDIGTIAIAGAVSIKADEYIDKTVENCAKIVEHVKDGDLIQIKVKKKDEAEDEEEIEESE